MMIIAQIYPGVIAVCAGVSGHSTVIGGITIGSDSVTGLVHALRSSRRIINIEIGGV